MKQYCPKLKSSNKF